MPKQDAPTFHVRLPPRLKATLQAAVAAKGPRHSLNKEINERLERSFEPDPAIRLAEALRPMLAALDETDQEKLVLLAAGAMEILRGPTKKRSRRK